ncbi:MAG: hypothetical protein EG823_07465 [Actinobacteria bacterium]|nr:hypothetical protein [Actinomycetota bacterium]
MSPRNAAAPPDRPSDRTPPVLAPSRLFTVWQRAVTAVLAAAARAGVWVRRATSAWASQWPQVRDYHARGAAAWTPADLASRRRAAAIGLRGFVFGLVIAWIISDTSRNTWLPGGVTVISEVLWAGARFIIIALLARRGTIDRPRLSTAYLAGLLPYTLALTGPLRIAALLLSAVATYRGLVGAGVQKPDARLMIGWSFGGQAGIMVAGILVRVVMALVAAG